MNSNFTDRVRKVLSMAREEATRLNHDYVGTEHILLGLIREGEGVAPTILTNLNVDLEDLRVAVGITDAMPLHDQSVANSRLHGSCLVRAGHSAVCAGRGCAGRAEGRYLRAARC